MREVMIVPTGTANMASIRAAFSRLGSRTCEAESPADVARARNLVVPGVGSFGAAVQMIDFMELRQALIERIESRPPTLAVCVGMQLLCRDSAESPGVPGLGVIPGSVDRFDGPITVPQLGWNEVVAGPESRYVESGWAYFANSYRLLDQPEGWRASTAEHGGRFIAALEEERVLALQFHPELSGSWGASILARWMESS